nr:hypothetical protein [uncultured Tateyamaria sp.]
MGRQGLTFAQLKDIATKLEFQVRLFGEFWVCEVPCVPDIKQRHMMSIEGEPLRFVWFKILYQNAPNIPVKRGRPCAEPCFGCISNAPAGRIRHQGGLSTRGDIGRIQSVVEMAVHRNDVFQSLSLLRRTGCVAVGRRLFAQRVNAQALQHRLNTAHVRCDPFEGQKSRAAKETIDQQCVMRPLN